MQRRRPRPASVPSAAWPHPTQRAPLMALLHAWRSLVRDFIAQQACGCTHRCLSHVLLDTAASAAPGIPLGHALFLCPSLCSCWTESPSKLHAVSTATLQSSSWPAFLSYALFPPTFLAGPIMTATEYYQQVRPGHLC